MKRFVLALLCSLVACAAVAQSNRPTRFMRAQWVDFDAGDTTSVVSATNFVDTDDLVLSVTDITESRGLRYTVVDTTPSLTGVTITTVGLGLNGRSVTDVVTGNGAGTYWSSIAFSSITSITANADGTVGGGGDETVSVGDGALVVDLGGRGCTGVFFDVPSGSANGVIVSINTAPAIRDGTTAVDYLNQFVLSAGENRALENHDLNAGNGVFSVLTNGAAGGGDLIIEALCFQTD